MRQNDQDNERCDKDTERFVLLQMCISEFFQLYKIEL